MLAKISSLISLGAKFRNVRFRATGLFDVVIWLKSASRLTSEPSFELGCGAVDEDPACGWVLMTGLVLIKEWLSTSIEEIYNTKDRQVFEDKGRLCFLVSFSK